MPDRIPQLDRLAADAKDVTMLPPAEIRRRGSRRRTTRHVSVAAGMLALVLTAGVGVWQSPLLDQFTNPQWANTAVPQTPSPTASDGATEVPSESPSASPVPQPTETVTSGTPVVPPTDPTVAPPSYVNLPTAEMLFPDYSPGEVKAEYEGLSPDAPVLCLPSEYGSPVTVLTREYGTQGDWPSFITAVVFGYESPEAASDGYDLITEAAATCPEPNPSFGPASDLRMQDLTGQVPFDDSTVDASPARMTFHSGSVLLTEKQDMGVFTDIAVVQAGERVLLMTSAFEGMDHNCASGPDDPDMEQCQVPAAIPQAVKTLVEPG